MSLFSAVLPEGEFRAAKCDMLEQLIAIGDGNAALLYLYILLHGRHTNTTQAMRDLRLSQEEFDKAAFTLTNLSISQTAAHETQKPKAAPKYTASELKSARFEDDRFRSVCSFAESTLNIPLSESMLRALYTIYEHIGLPAEVMVELISFLKADKGAVSSRELIREAYIWSDKALFTVSEVQNYLSALQLQKPLRDAIYKIIGAVGRIPTLAEKNLVVFCVEKGFSKEAVQLAYDRMMRYNGTYSLNYLKKVLQSWDNKNIHTLSEITAIEPERGADRKTEKPAATGSDLSAWEQDWLDEMNRRKAARRKDQES